MARILLAEDDSSLRGFLTRALERAGHQVIDCENGDDAIDALEHGPYDLLLTDIVMPGGMFGGELVDAVRSLRPDLPMLLSTGYSETEITGHGPLPANAPVLRKPYSPQQLAEAVERCLSPSGASATT